MAVNTLKKKLALVTVAVALLSACSPEGAYLQALEDADLSSQFAADRAAIAAADRTCADLDAGGDPQGTEADRIAVEHYCDDYLEAFTVLEVTDVNGTFELFDDDAFFLPECKGDGGYGDLNASTAVILRDRDGEELARTELGFGDGDLGSCLFSFRLRDVSEGAPGDVYVLEVGDRGEISYSFFELTLPGIVALSIGN